MNLSDYHDNREAIIAKSRSVLGPSTILPFIPSTAPCYLNGPQSPLQPSALLLPSVISSALCLLYSHLSPLHHYVPSTVLFSLYNTLYLL
jgi:hypothetical protein